jgi:exodeoxyribonuclease VII large subunit
MPDSTADLFFSPAESSPVVKPRVYSVGDVTRAIRSVVEGAFMEVWVEGEVSNHRQQASGHQYFTLKDDTSQLACVLFARPGMWKKSSVSVRDGMLVQAKGRITVYEARGQYQLNVTSLQEAGAGQLQARFEALKRKLAAEGLFDAEHKRELPQFPRTVGIVTSPTGAALRDMLQIFARRAPWLRVIVSPCRVQGTGAADEIVTALDNLQKLDEPVDVIVLARGGGSIEDLWEFNNEDLARAIAGSSVPVVSAVGHEIDFTIADFVADFRAPTPSAAAEIVAPDSEDLRRRLAESARRMLRAVSGELDRGKSALALLSSHSLFREPQQRFEQLAQSIDLAEQSLERGISDALSGMKADVAGLEARLLQHRPDQVIALHRQQLAAISARMKERSAALIARRASTVERLDALLRVLSPDSTVKRGYTITMDGEGRLLRTAAEAAVAKKMITRFADGNVESAPAKPRKPRKKAEKAD